MATSRAHFATIDCATINTYDLVNFDERHKVGLLGMKRARRPVTTVYLHQCDRAKGLAQFSYYPTEPDIDVEARVNERVVTLFYVSRCTSRMLNHIYCL